MIHYHFHLSQQPNRGKIRTTNAHYPQTQTKSKKRNKFSIFRNWGAVITSNEIEKTKTHYRVCENENRNLTDLREANRS